MTIRKIYGNNCINGKNELPHQLSEKEKKNLESGKRLGLPEQASGKRLGLPEQASGKRLGLPEQASGKSKSTNTDPPPGPIRNIAEFEPMQGVLIRYPFGISASVIKEMAEDVIVYCLVSSSQQNSAYNSMNNANVNMKNVEFIVGNTDSYWTRDYGPWWIIDTNNNIGIVDFIYNRPRENDNEAPSKVSNHLNVPYYSANFVSTGGNYMVDGFTTASSTHIAYTENNLCYTNNETNVPLQPCSYIDSIMNNNYGINKYHVVADPNNEYIDHIDCWAKFLCPTKLLIREVPSSHTQYNEIEAIVTYFSNNTLYEIIRVYTPENQPYTNSLILNNKVLVPIMNNSWDDDALKVYQTAMPGYEIIGFTGTWEPTDALHCRVKGIPNLSLSSNMVNIQIKIGWNMVSSPYNYDTFANQILPDHIDNTVYSYNDSYESSNKLIPTKGYWVKYETSKTITHNIFVFPSINIELQEGWNMIGGAYINSNKNNIIDENTIIIPNTLYYYDSVYIESNIIEPIKGYWIKAFSSGSIQLNNI